MRKATGYWEGGKGKLLSQMYCMWKVGYESRLMFAGRRYEGQEAFEAERPKEI